MRIGARKLLMAFLVLAYVLQTGIVYSDGTADQREALSPLALQGRRLWHSHNCQACHQFYGFGGFLGPDLTNASSRLTRVRLDHILTRGSVPMPAFWMTAEEIDAIEAYLAAMDRTGVGVARSHPPLDQDKLWKILEGTTMPLEARRGMALFRRQCTVCHVPFQSTSLGLQTAPDLSTVIDRLTLEDIDETMRMGRPEKGMPPTHLDAHKRKRVQAFFAWMHGERGKLLPMIRGPVEASGLPWWTYR